jgi:Domain of unknown function (DUF4265)
MIQARVEMADGRERWEQLWTREVGPERFQICCIPFFLYDVALGDEVEGRDYVLERVLTRSGRQTLRAWFREVPVAEQRQEFETVLSGLGCLYEWHNGRLLAIDAENDFIAQDVANRLLIYEHRGLLLYEAGESYR